MQTRFIIAVAATLLVSALAHGQERSPAGGDDEAARRLFQAGKASFDAGDFEQALRFFEQSHERSRRPQLLYNVGLAADRLRQDDKALTAFHAYLEQVPAAENRAEVEARIIALERARDERDAASALTPAETAQAAQPQSTTHAVSGTAPTAAPSDDTPITKQWWFWAGAGAVLVGGVVLAVALASGGDKKGEPIESRTGITVMALERR